MKTKYIIALFAIGLSIVILGALFKILHYAGASELLLIGMGTQALCSFLIAIKLIRAKDFKDFMNK